VSRDRSIYLRHVLDLIERIKAYIADGEAAFKTDPKTQDAVLHNLGITSSPTFATDPRHHG
jgi:uncharacterized protein with HEPN domain